MHTCTSASLKQGATSCVFSANRNTFTKSLAPNVSRIADAVAIASERFSPAIDPEASSRMTTSLALAAAPTYQAFDLESGGSDGH